MPSISFRKSGHHTSINHNNRVFKNKNVDESRTKNNIIFIQEDIKKTYSIIFDKSVNEYNQTQKRADRKINNYYEKIKNDKKTNVQQELIIQIGDITNAEENWDKYKNILNEYAKKFIETNKNLVVYNAALHLDEATPHLHINFVPVGHYEKGLKCRVSFDKAIKEQGFETFTDWRNVEISKIESMMNDLGLERELVGSHDYQEIKDYKFIKNEIDKEINRLKNNNIQDIDIKPVLFSKDEIKISKKDFEKIEKMKEEYKTGSIILNNSLLSVSILEKKYRDFDKKYKELEVKTDMYMDLFSQEEAKTKRLTIDNAILREENKELTSFKKKSEKKLSELKTLKENIEIWDKNGLNLDEMLKKDLHQAETIKTLKNENMSLKRENSLLIKFKESFPKLFNFFNEILNKKQTSYTSEKFLKCEIQANINKDINFSLKKQNEILEKIEIGKKEKVRGFHL